MNERIKELSNQAGLHDFVITAMGIDEEVEAFAKLIIQECTNMLPEDSIRNSEGVHMLHVIREHFGVK